MNRSMLGIVLFVVAAALAGAPAHAAPAATKPAPAAAPAPKAAASDIVHAPDDDAIAKSLEADLATGRERIERFFDRPFAKPFTVEIFPDRAAFDAYFKSRWGLPETQAWMVAMGVGDRLAVLSPRVWKTQAAEHDPDDPAHLQDIVAHELVHVFHGQANPHPDFDGMDDMGWFVEGLAVYVSGQLERSHKGKAAEAMKAGKLPERLADAWSGRFRYGVAGSMAAYVDRHYGRDVLNRMLATVTNDEALALMKTNESDFLAAWKADLTATP